MGDFDNRHLRFEDNYSGQIPGLQNWVQAERFRVNDIATKLQKEGFDPDVAFELSMLNEDSLKEVLKRITDYEKQGCPKRESFLLVRDEIDDRSNKTRDQMSLFAWTVSGDSSAPLDDTGPKRVRSKKGRWMTIDGEKVFASSAAEGREILKERRAAQREKELLEKNQINLF